MNTVICSLSLGHCAPFDNMQTGKLKTQAVICGFAAVNQLSGHLCKQVDISEGKC